MSRVPKAGAYYNGLRVTLTDAPDASCTIVTVMVKAPSGRWDDWSMLFPAIRMDLQDPIRSAADAARAIEEAVGMVLAQME